MNKKILIIGGYGNTGRLIAELLLKETAVQLVLAGRNEEKAQAMADQLNQKYPHQRVSAVAVDASDFKNLLAILPIVDLVVVASSTIDHVHNVAQAAIAARVDYLDTQLSTAAKINTLRSLQAKIVEANCCFITDAGFHPGVPAALVRYAATVFDRLEKANVSSLIKLNWRSYTFSDNTVKEMIEEFKHFQPMAFQNGVWKKMSWSYYKRVAFGSDWGKRYCVPMMMEEMRSLPQEIPSLQETGFYVAGFHWLIDYFIMPLIIIALKIFPVKAVAPAGKIFEWSLKTVCAPPFQTILILEAAGSKAEQTATMRILLAHEDGYLLTAVPIVACLLQYLNDSIRQPGLWFQANIVDPIKFLHDIERMGIQLQIEQKSEII